MAKSEDAVLAVVGDVDVDAGFVGDGPPTATMPFAKFIDPMSKEAKDGATPYVYLDTSTGATYEPPLMINPLVAECWWVEWAKNEDGTPRIDGSPPVFKTNSYQEAVKHFPLGSNNRSTEFFHRQFYVLANVESDGTVVDHPLIFTFKGGSASSAASMMSVAMSRTYENGSRAHLFAQWWELSITKERSKKSGVDYTKQNLKFDSVDNNPKFLEANAAAYKEIEQVGLGVTKLLNS